MLIFSIFLMHLKLFLFLYNVQLEFSQERGSREKVSLLRIRQSIIATWLIISRCLHRDLLQGSGGLRPSFSIPQAPEDGMVRP